MTQVFISYSRKDLDFVEQLAGDLENAGLDVWYDVSGISGGSRWRSEIENAIRSSQYVIVVLSPDSIASEWVEREFLFASNLQRKIIPLMYRVCELPLNYLDLNYIDVQGGNYQREFPNLLRALTIDPKTAPLPIVRAQKRSSPLKMNYIVSSLVVIAIALTGWFLFQSNRNPSTLAPTLVPGTSIAQAAPTTAESTATENIVGTSTPESTATQLITPTVAPLPNEIVDGVGSKMVLIPAGEFMMGSNWGENEKPIHPVTLDAFYMDKFEVTNAQYQMCVADGSCRLPIKTDSKNRLSYYGDPKFVEYPVIWVNWNMAKIYCEWRGARLPTEAEWEKAARGTDQRKYPWGDGFDCAYGNFLNCKGETDKVGAYESGRSIYGVYDLAGNVWEWVFDLYDERFYSSAAALERNPQRTLWRYFAYPEGRQLVEW